MTRGTYQSSEHKEYTGQHPDLYGSHACITNVKIGTSQLLGDLTLCLGSVGGDVVEDVDQHEEERDEERHPPGDDVRRNHEADPRHHHKQA